MEERARDKGTIMEDRTTIERSSLLENVMEKG